MFRASMAVLDYWIIKLDANGTEQWAKCYGGSEHDFAYSISQTPDTGYIIAGCSLSNDDEVTGNHGTADYWIVKINDTGAIEWEKCLGGSNGDGAQSIQPTTDGGFIVAGGSNSEDGDVTGLHYGYDSVFQRINDDYWIVKLIPPPPVIFSSQQQTLPGILCNAKEAENDTLVIHNTDIGGGQLVIDSSSWSAAGLSLVSPALPVIIYGGDSMQFVVRYTPAGNGAFAATLNLYSNDTTHNPWQINFTGNNANIGFDIQDVASDTLDFGRSATAPQKIRRFSSSTRLRFKRHFHCIQAARYFRRRLRSK